MTRYLIDSDVTIDYRAGVASVASFVEPLVADGIAVSVITQMEVYQGLLRLPEPPSPQALDAFVADMVVLPVTRDVAERCAEIRADLRHRGRAIRSRALDLLIAATAVEFALILVTRNIADYGDVPSLQLMTPPGDSSGSG